MDAVCQTETQSQNRCVNNINVTIFPWPVSDSQPNTDDIITHRHFNFMSKKIYKPQKAEWVVGDGVRGEEGRRRSSRSQELV